MLLIDNQQLKIPQLSFLLFLKESVSKPNRAILSSVVGAGFVCPKTQSKLFSGEQPRLYELNDSVIHVLTQPRVKACSLTRNETPKKVH